MRRSKFVNRASPIALAIRYRSVVRSEWGILREAKRSLGEQELEPVIAREHVRRVR